jgi:hypothetical protein
LVAVGIQGVLLHSSITLGCSPCFQFHGWSLLALQGKCTYDQHQFLQRESTGWGYYGSSQESG